MNKLSNITNLQQLGQEKLLLQKKIRKQEDRLMGDVASIQSTAQKWVDGVFRVKNILQFFIPKMEFATVLFPVVKRLFFKRKKK